VCCSVLQCVAVCCSVMQNVAECCSVLYHTVPPKDILVGMLQCVAVCCSVMQCVVECCSVLQRVAVFCSLLHHTVPPSKDIFISEFKPQILKSKVFLSETPLCQHPVYIYSSDILYSWGTFQHPAFIWKHLTPYITPYII